MGVPESVFTVPLADLRRRKSLKWRRYAPDVLPLWVAEMDASVPPGAAAAISDALTRGDLGYPFGHGYAEAFADFAAERWGWRPDPAHTRLAPDVLAGIRLLIALTTRPGDAVVINPPVYPPFFGEPGVVGRRALEVPLTATGRLDLVALEDAFARPDVTAYLLCSPHNPTSVVHTRAELAAVAEASRRHGVTVIVDEIHAPFAPPGHVPYPSVDPAGFVVTSASKSWNLAALKGALLIGGPSSAARLGELSPFETEYAIGHLAVLAHTAALTHDREWLDGVRAEVDENRALLVRLIAEHLPAVRYAPGDGTYLAWLDLRDLDLPDPADHFLQHARVALNPGREFGADYAGFARLNLATSPQILTEAIVRVAASLSDGTHHRR